MKKRLARNPFGNTGVLACAMRRAAARSALFLFGLGGVLALATPAGAADEPSAAALPDLQVLLGEVRERLHSDDFLLDQYTFTEKQTERRLDTDGNVKKMTTSLYEVYPSPEPGRTYRKLVERDGKPLTAEELAKEDQKQEAKEARKAARLYGEDASRRASAESERRLKETRTIDELFRIYEFRIVGRETLDGRGAIVVTFEPRPGVETETRSGKILRKFAGRAWIDEEDRQLVRVEAELTDDLSFGFGILAKLKKGSRAQIQRRKINDEIWLPAQAHFAGNARLFIVKGLHIDTLSEYSDYKKFTVATEAAAVPEQPKQP
jgi:hypothetical protein